MSAVITGWRSRYRSDDEDGTADRPSKWMTTAIIVSIVLIIVLLVVMALWAKGWVLNPS